MMQKVSRRDVLKVGMAGLLALPGTGLASAILAACQSSTGGGGATKPSSLNMLYATVEADSDAIKLVVSDFKQALGIDLHLDTMPYDALQQKVFSELASSSSFYDILIVDTPWMPALTEKIQPITGYIMDSNLTDAAKLNIADFIPKVFYDTAVYQRSASNKHFSGGDTVDPKAIKDSGFEIYGLPIQANALTMSYRKDLFDDAANQSAFKARFGSDLAAPQTWEDFVKVAQFFTRPPKLYGTTLMAGNGDWATDDFKTLLACWGGDGHLVNDQFQPVFNSPEGVAALTFYQDLINKYKVTPPGTTSASWDEVATTFGSGLAAMSFNYHTVALNTGVSGTIAYAEVPKNVASGPHFGTWMLSVNSFSKNKEWAYKAIVWLTGSDVQTKMLQTQLHPTRRSVYSAAQSSTQLKQFGNFYDVLGKALAAGVGRPRLRNYADVDKAVWVAVNDAARGAKSPAAALSSAATQVTAALKQAGYTT